ncbi:MAG: hypothetical protein ACXVCY_12025 [Pseudobdellovibrionaceae bacterium]
MRSSLKMLKYLFAFFGLILFSKMGFSATLNQAIPVGLISSEGYACTATVFKYKDKIGNENCKVVTCRHCTLHGEIFSYGKKLKVIKTSDEVHDLAEIGVNENLSLTKQENIFSKICADLPAIPYDSPEANRVLDDPESSRNYVAVGIDERGKILTKSSRKGMIGGLSTAVPYFNGTPFVKIDQLSIQPGMSGGPVYGPYCNIYCFLGINVKYPYNDNSTSFMIPFKEIINFLEEKNSIVKDQVQNLILADGGGGHGDGGNSVVKTKHRIQNLADLVLPLNFNGHKASSEEAESIEVMFNAIGSGKRSFVDFQAVIHEYAQSNTGMEVFTEVSQDTLLLSLQKFKDEDDLFLIMGNYRTRSHLTDFISDFVSKSSETRLELAEKDDDLSLNLDNSHLNCLVGSSKEISCENKNQMFYIIQENEHMFHLNYAYWVIDNDGNKRIRKFEADLKSEFY